MYVLLEEIGCSPVVECSWYVSRSLEGFEVSSRQKRIFPNDQHISSGNVAQKEALQIVEVQDVGMRV